MTPLTKKPFQVYLREDQLESLRALAERREVSIAELIRQSVDRFLTEVSAEEDPLWDIMGLFDSGRGDLAEKHDQYLAQMIQEENR